MRCFLSKLLLNARPGEWVKPKKVFNLDQSRDVIYDGSQFVIFGQKRGTTKIIGYISTSSDGKAYTSPTKYSELAGATYPMPNKSYGWQGIAKTNNRYCVISIPRSYSTDGCIRNFSTTSSLTSWFTSANDINLRKRYISICANSTIHAALSDEGIYALTGAGDDPEVDFWQIGRIGSTDGFSSGSVINYINDKFVAVGEICTDPAYGIYNIAFATNVSDTIRNAGSWTIIQPNNANNLKNYNWIAIDYFNSKYILISKDGYITESTDLINWTIPTQPHNLALEDDEWAAFAHNGSIAVLLSNDGYISTKNI